MTQTALSPRTWFELTLLALLWGGSFLSNLVALDELGPLTIVALRVSLACAVLWAVVLFRGQHVPRGLRTWGAFAVMGLLNNAIPFSLYSWGQQFIPSGLTAIFNATTAIFGVLVAALVFADERLTARRALGVAIGFAGVLTAIGPAALLRLDLTSLAQLGAIAATFCYALAGAWARHFLKGVSPVMAATGMLTCSSVMMIPVSLWAEGPPPLVLHPATWAAVLYYALIATALAYLLYYRVLAAAGSGNLLLVTLMIPPVAIALGAWLRNETLPPQAYAGFALLALGLAVLDGRLLRRRQRV
ncbi:DMT family transporter [Mesobacterium sp. TK19101]|uniref:DMT family transporter n=1 Tax=Mesobacterium hydrothermale TaxID=3111907 RepID=A0ABU6HEU1_9RHOB|nr:DMT family transporter [Mesobacterium sp. TK19101]MEC3860962.1 DMT family transporter [Mesobacterium sp. TK19101]